MGLLCGLCLWPAAAQAQEVAPYSERYTGSFVGLQALGGVAWSQSEGGGAGEAAPSFGVMLQATSPLQILDAQTGWQRSSTKLDLGQGQRLDLTSDALVSVAGLHPLFILGLEGGWNTFLSGIYLLAGVDLERVEGSAPWGAVSDWDAGFFFGGGLDVPLDDIDDGGAFWLGLQYRYNPTDLDQPGVRDFDLVQHATLVRVSYRHNGLLVPIPASVWP
jgi:hypothetical protein